MYHDEKWTGEHERECREYLKPSTLIQISLTNFNAGFSMTKIAQLAFWYCRDARISIVVQGMDILIYIYKGLLFKSLNFYAPPSLVFFYLLKISWGNPHLKILDLANLFVADAPIYIIIFYPLLEHFEISVRKPPVHKRVNRLLIKINPCLIIFPIVKHALTIVIISCSCQIKMAKMRHLQFW